MTRPDEIAALASKLERASLVGSDVLSNLDLLNAASALRLSATSPGDAAREGWTGKKCPYCKGTGENLSDPMSSKSCQHCGGTGDEYAALAPAEKAGDMIAVSAVKGMITRWQKECFAFPDIYNQGNVLLDRLEALAATPMPPSADVERLSRDWKTVEEQIASASGNDFLILMRDYLHINSGPGNDLAPLYIARINLLIQSAAHGGGTKSDGGVEGHALSWSLDSTPDPHGRIDHPMHTESEAAGIKPGPSDTMYGEYTPVTVRASSAPSDPAQEPITDLEWLSAHQSLELSFDGFGDDDPSWKVHQVTGGRNDREWNLVGSGDTPANALKAARFALNITEQKP